MRRVHDLASDAYNVGSIVCWCRVLTVCVAGGLSELRLVDLDANLITRRREGVRVLEMATDALTSARIKDDGRGVFGVGQLSVKCGCIQDVGVVGERVRRPLGLIYVRIRHGGAIRAYRARGIHRRLDASERAEFVLTILAHPAGVKRRDGGTVDEDAFHDVGRRRRLRRVIDVERNELCRGGIDTACQLLVQCNGLTVNRVNGSRVTRLAARFIAGLLYGMSQLYTQRRRGESVYARVLSSDVVVYIVFSGFARWYLVRRAFLGGYSGWT